MNDQSQGYDTVPAGGNPRGTEGWALIQAARRMATSILMEGSDKDRKNAMLAAVRLNWRLWTIFQAELVGENSGVPLEIRQNMLTLCNFVDKHTINILAAPTPEKLTTLIEINRNIGAGLLGDGGAATEAPGAEGPQAEMAAPVSIDQET